MCDDDALCPTSWSGALPALGLLGTQALDEDSDWQIEWCVPCVLGGAVRHPGAAGILPYWRGGERAAQAEF